MKKFLTIAAIGSLAGLALMAQSKVTPLNVKTGLWQSTTTMLVSPGPGIPPESAANLSADQKARGEAAMAHSARVQPRIITNKGCLTQDDLTRDPFSPEKINRDMKCHENLIRSTGSDAEVAMTCADDQGNTADFHLLFHAVDQEHATGSGQGTVNMFGHSMKSNWKFQSQWLQASCPVQTQ